MNRTRLLSRLRAERFRLLAIPPQFFGARETRRLKKVNRMISALS